MLVGRDAERQRIDGLIAAARVGRSGVLVVTGEAGIGKTTLLEYARNAAGGMRLLTASGSEAEQDVPFGGLAQLLRPTSEDLAQIPEPQALALGVALALREGPVADRLAVGAAVLSLLTRYSEHRPLGVLVDDAHLLDRPTAEALAFACRRLLADPMFVIIAARSGEVSALTTAGLPDLLLAGLDAEATTELVHSRAQPVTADRLELLHRVTGGNPLAVLELARDPTTLLSLAPGSEIPVPTALIDWFGRRVGALGDDARALLLLSATAGGDLAVVIRAGEMLGVSLQAVSEAERAGLVTISHDRLDFSHPLVRASVLSLAFPDQRREIHAAVAEAVPVQDVDRRAWHRCEATVGFDDVVAMEMEGLADRAAARGAYAVSATAYQRAARLSSTDSERARRLLVAGEAAWRAGDGDWATALLHSGIALDSSPTARARALAVEGDIAARRGAPARAQRLFLSAADEVVEADPSRAVLLIAEAVSAGYFQGDAAAAVAAAERAEHLLARDLTPTAAAVGTLATGMARILAGRSGSGRIRAGVQMLDAASGTADADSVRPEWLMFGPLWLRESGTGRSLVRTALEQGRAGSAVSALPTLLFTIARDGAATDHWASAEADYDEAISLSRELGYTTELAMSLAGLAWLEARLGRVEACRAHSAETLELCATWPVNTARVWAEFALGELALAAGDVPGALAVFSDLAKFLVEIDLRDPDLSPAPELAEAFLRNGDEATAQGVATSYQVAATDKGLPWGRARAARLQGMLCDAVDVDDCFNAALALHAQTPDVFEEARTRLAFGARLRRIRRRADARVPLRAALSVFERLGARPRGRLRCRRARGERRDRPQGGCHRCREPHASRASDRSSAGSGAYHSRERRRSVPEPEDGRVPPASRLHQAGYHHSRRAGRPARSRNGLTSSPGPRNFELRRLADHPLAA